MSTSTSERSAAGSRPPRAFLRGVAAAALPAGPASTGPVAEEDLTGLPPPAARYLRAMGVVGRPRTWSLRAHFVGRFRRRAHQPWMSMDAWQYNSAVDVARLFRMRLTFARVVPMWGWDTYRAGTGRMIGKALDLVTVADGSGPQFDISELVTWLNDAVLMAPSMLLGPDRLARRGRRQLPGLGHRRRAHRERGGVPRRPGAAPRLPHRGPLRRPARRAGAGALEHPGGRVDRRRRTPTDDGWRGGLAPAGREVPLRRDDPGRPRPRRPPEGCPPVGRRRFPRSVTACPVGKDLGP